MNKARALIFAILLAGLATHPAQALNCTKAKIEAEKIICANPDLKQADAKLARAYFALRRKIGPAGRKKLQEMQRKWLARRNRMIVENTIAEATADHTEFLLNTPPGMVPFLKETTANKGQATTSVRGYKFPAPKTPVQKVFNTLFNKLYEANRNKPENKANEDVDATAVTRFDKYIISSRIYTDGFYGGAHPLHFAVQVNIDVPKAKPLKIESLFAKKSLNKLVLSCAAELADFQNKFDLDTPEKALKAFNEDYPGEIKKHINDVTRWIFDKTAATVFFNEYTIAPYAAGEQRCTFSYKTLAPLSRRPEVFSLK